MAHRLTSPHDRWFFQDPESGDYVVTIENPTRHAGFLGWKAKLNKDGCVMSEHPVVAIRGRELWGYPMKATPTDTIICSESCENASGPECKCSCGGKNHGIHHLPPPPGG
jgi:hypothetical protein